MNKIKFLIALIFLAASNLLAEEFIFKTITEALAFDGDRDALTKLTITDSIAGTDYSDDSEWSKFRTLDETFPNIEEVEIWTDQDIPDINTIYSVYLFFFFDGRINKGTEWLKKFSAPNVKIIGKNTFCYCHYLEEINFNSAIEVGDFTFYGCYRLNTIYCPLVQKIGNSGFWRTALTSVDFPYVTIIGEKAFQICRNLEYANFPAAKVIGGTAFQMCVNLKEINFPSVTHLLALELNGEGSHFSVCSSLVSADFPSLIITEGGGSFAICTSLVFINLPSIRTLSWGNFSNRCENIVSANFGTGFNSEREIKFGRNVFSADITKNIELTLGDYVLPAPDLTNNIWQGNNIDTNYKDYVWKIIKTNIKEIIKNIAIKIFPNPTNDFVNISFDLEKTCNVKIIIVDILGKEFMEVHNGFIEEGLFTKTIDIQKLSKGTYFLKIIIDNDYLIEKIKVF